MANNNGPGPPQAEYGADEVSAIVLDPGYSLIRAGFAGEDAPKSVIPTHYGIVDSSSEHSNRGYNGSNLIFGDNGIHLPRPNFEIRNPMSRDGIVEDWDVAAKQWEYAITSRLTGQKSTPPARNGLNDRTQEEKNSAGEQGEGDVDMEDVVENQEKPLEESPLLMAEPGWNPAKNREKAIELAMEDWGAPAFFLARNGVLSSFASGKASALVIDIGASNVSVTPVYDGMMLKKGTVKSPLAGYHISNQLRALFSQHSPPITLVPHYLVTSKTPVDANTPAAATYRSFTTPPAPSFRALEEERILTEFKESCVQAWNPSRHMGSSLAGASEFLKNSENGRPFEMPDGWNDVFGVERYRAAEGLFDEKAIVSDTAWWTAPGEEEKLGATHAMTIPGLIHAALAPLDVDVKSTLLANVVVTGGSSLIQGMTDRIQYEIQSMFQGARVRIQAPGNLVERRFAGWIGGSILASLGTFHQLWVSRKEYEESGAGIVERRCK